MYIALHARRPGNLYEARIRIFSRRKSILRSDTRCVSGVVCRANGQVYSSINEPYEGAKGSMIRRMFKRLPGVGAATARLWYNMGFRRATSCLPAVQLVRIFLPGLADYVFFDACGRCTTEMLDCWVLCNTQNITLTNVPQQKCVRSLSRLRPEGVRPGQWAICVALQSWQMHPCVYLVQRLGHVPCRTYEDVEHAMRPGGRLARGGETPMSIAQAFSVQHRADLLAACPPADIDEMRAAVLASLNKVAGVCPACSFCICIPSC